MPVFNVETGDEIEHISKNDEVKVSDIIEGLELVKLSLHKNLDNVEKESDKRNWVDMSDDMDFAEKDEISKRL